MEEKFSVTIESYDSYAVLTPVGPVLGSGIVQLREALDEYLKAPAQNLLIELSGILYFTSGALDVLLKARKKAMDHRCRVVLVSSQEEIQELIEITGCKALFPFYNSLDAAIRELQLNS